MLGWLAGDGRRIMIRISTIFIGFCMALLAASLGLILYSVAGISGTESAIVAATALTFLLLYNAVAMRVRDRGAPSSQIADLSRGTAELAKQVAEFGRRLAAVEGRLASGNSANADRLQSVIGEISELGGLVKQLAVNVAAHDDLLAGASAPSRTPARTAEAEQPVNSYPAPPAATRVQPSFPAANVSAGQLLATLRQAVEENRLDIFLQPMVTLPQRKVRFYEAVTRLRDEHDRILTAEDFIGVAETGGLIGRIDNMVLLRCVQVLRRLMVRNKDVGVFCNMAGSTLGDPTTFAQCLDFLEANRSLAPSLVIEFKQETFRNLGAAEAENLAALAQCGYRFSIDHVTDLRIEPRELAERGVRFIKVPAALLLDADRVAAADIHPSDLSDLLGRFGIDLIAERIEGERAVVDLLEYDVRFGQGFLFAPPRPLRPEGASASAGATPARAPQAQGFDDSPQAGSGQGSAPPPPRASGMAALVRRAAGNG
jgi:cyclic-di-GMP phosphodiesterase, flagellum assembly factor TipF